MHGNYARTDIATTFASNVNIGGGDFAFRTVGGTGTAILTNTRIDGNFEIFNNLGGISTRTLSISGSTGLITVAGNPVNSMHVATKGYVDGLVTTTANRYALLNSPALTGAPTATNPLAADNSNRIATTAFTKSAIEINTNAKWQGSARFVSTITPSSVDGDSGDFWFQI